MVGLGGLDRPGLGPVEGDLGVFTSRGGAADLERLKVPVGPGAGLRPASLNTPAMYAAAASIPLRPGARPSRASSARNVTSERRRTSDGLATRSGVPGVGTSPLITAGKNVAERINAARPASLFLFPWRVPKRPVVAMLKHPSWNADASGMRRRRRRGDPVVSALILGHSV